MISLCFYSNQPVCVHFFSDVNILVTRWLSALYENGRISSIKLELLCRALRAPGVILNCHSSFFSFFPSRHFFWTDCRKLFSQCFIISYQESVLPRSDLFLGRTKISFCKNCSSSCYSRCVWHMTHLIHGNQYSQHP